MLDDVRIEPGSIDAQRTAKVTLGCGEDSCELTVLAPDDLQMFKRNALKGVGTPSMVQTQWLVVRYKDLSVYVKTNGEIIISREDLYP